MFVTAAQAVSQLICRTTKGENVDEIHPSSLDILYKKGINSLFGNSIGLDVDPSLRFNYNL